MVLTFRSCLDHLKSLKIITLFKKYLFTVATDWIEIVCVFRKFKNQLTCIRLENCIRKGIIWKKPIHLRGYFYPSSQVK